MAKDTTDAPIQPVSVAMTMEQLQALIQAMPASVEASVVASAADRWGQGQGWALRPRGGRHRWADFRRRWTVARGSRRRRLRRRGMSSCN